MKIDSVSPSVAPGHQPNVTPSSGAEPPLQNVRPGNWASPAGPSTLTHKARYDANKEGKALVRWAINESKREPGARVCLRNSRTPFVTPIPMSDKQCEEI